MFSVLYNSFTLIQKVNITVITTLDTDWPQEATLSVVLNSYIRDWVLNVGQIVPLSVQEATLSVVLTDKKLLSVWFSTVTLETGF